MDKKGDDMCVQALVCPVVSLFVHVPAVLSSSDPAFIYDWPGHES